MVDFMPAPEQYNVLEAHFGLGVLCSSRGYSSEFCCSKTRMALNVMMNFFWPNKMEGGSYILLKNVK